MAEEQSWGSVTADGPVPANQHGEVGVWPLDQHNVKLLDCVHPRGWKNPKLPENDVYDLVAVGGGAAGLISAKQTARRGGRSALIEQHLAGGDCLNVGCVPSKALLRCARAFAERRRSDLGAESSAFQVDFSKVMSQMREKRAHIADVDSHETSQKVGVDVYVGRGVFTGPHELSVDGQTLKFRKAIIATGARAGVPPIPGLSDVPYLTNSTLFNLTELPPRFVVIGGGPIGLEMAQAFRRFGSQTTVLEVLPRILGPEDPDASMVIHRVLEEEGVRVLTGIKITSISHSSGELWPKISISVDNGGACEELECDALLVAAGRVPNVENLGLEAAGVDFKPRVGVLVGDDLSTSNPDIFAAGDCVDKPALRFTHTAASMATMAIINALFGGNGLPVMAPSPKLSEIVVPRCTYTEPEVASCGIANLKAAESAGIEVDVYSASLDHNDRAILERHCPGGFVKILCKKGSDEIVGGLVVAERAGDMLAEITLAAQHKLGLAALGHTIHPYPTMGEAVQQCGIQYIRAHWQRL